MKKFVDDFNHGQILFKKKFFIKIFDEKNLNANADESN
jgi:hypothetical protein